LRVERTGRVYEDEAIPVIHREIETVVRGATAPSAVGDDRPTAGAGIDRHVIADIVVGRLQFGMGDALRVHRIGHRVEYSHPAPCALRCVVLPYPARGRRIDVSDAVEPQLANRRALQLVSTDPHRRGEYSG